jgi:hypothetical protein
MGVIAVAAYPEIRRYEPPINYSYTDQAKKMKEPSRDKAMAPSVQGRSEALESAGTGYGRDKAMAPSVQGRSEALESAGTGYGEEEYSPSYRVEFEPEKKAIESILIKYEWRKTLCHMNIINCGVAFEYSHNRIWENDGYAPAPPCRH